SPDLRDDPGRPGGAAGPSGDAATPCSRILTATVVYSLRVGRHGSGRAQQGHGAMTTTNPTTDPSAYAERRIPRDAYSLYARDYPGASPAFVLMHGFPDNLRIYAALAPLLARAARRVVAFDFLGYGGSDKPADSPSTATNNVALVTGVSSGIGRATAELLAEHGFRVEVLARRAVALASGPAPGVAVFSHGSPLRIGDER